METGYLWPQAAVKNKKLQVRKVAGEGNPVDLFAKHLGPKTCGSTFRRWECRQKKVVPPRYHRFKGDQVALMHLESTMPVVVAEGSLPGSGFFQPDRFDIDLFLI